MNLFFLGSPNIPKMAAERDYDGLVKCLEHRIKVGLASAAIKKGDYIHTHNMRSYRWEASRA